MASEYENQGTLRFLEDLGRSSKVLGKGALRGAIAGILGAPGDARDMFNMDPPEHRYHAMDSEDFARSLSDEHPTLMGYSANEPTMQDKIAEAIGGLVTPGPEEMLTLGKAAIPAIAAALPIAHVMSGDVSVARKSAGPLKDQLGAVKPKGGNWLEPPKVMEDNTPEFWGADQHLVGLDDGEEQPYENLYNAVSDWWEKKPIQWRRKFLGTSEDPLIDLVRARGEINVGGPYGPVTDWEHFGDSLVDVGPKSDILDKKLFDQYPWLENLPEDAPLYSLTSEGNQSLSDLYTHLADVLLQHPRGQDPEFYKNLSFPQAIAHMMDYDTAQAKKMGVAAGFEGTTIHRDYPDTGFKWVNINGGEGDKADPAWRTRLDTALKKEGDNMGHCVGGYCDQVTSGRSKIYSLRDLQGQSHVTIEAGPNPNAQGPYGSTDIYQIRGKQNRKPEAKYIPYVQDFLKSGNWGKINDLENTDLLDATTGLNSRTWSPETMKWFEENHPGLFDQIKVRDVGDMIQNLPNRFHTEDEFRKALAETILKRLGQ